MSMRKEMLELVRMTMLGLAAAAAGCDGDPLDHEDLPEDAYELRHGDPLVEQDTPGAVHAYEVRVQKWIEWISEQPWQAGPLFDQDGSRCGFEQSGGTWFLAGTTGSTAERSCTVPAGKHLFFPLVNRWVVQYPDAIDDAFIEWATGYLHRNRDRVCDLTLRLDGEDLLPDFETMKEELYAEQLEPFETAYGEDNLIGDPSYAGTYVNMAEGHWALLHPLPPGDHELEFGGKQCSNGAVYFDVAVTYHLHVEDEGDEDE